VCLQEHLQFFAGVKGVPNDQIDAMVTKSIADVGLVEKTNVQSSALSGGMKRKLSVAIALIGDSKVVFLGVCCSRVLRRLWLCVSPLRVLCPSQTSPRAALIRTHDARRGTCCRLAPPLVSWRHHRRPLPTSVSVNL
jgi:ABC-type transport system involved in cytochrome c biogenesis ATPase subunit